MFLLSGKNILQSFCTSFLVLFIFVLLTLLSKTTERITAQARIEMKHNLQLKRDLTQRMSVTRIDFQCWQISVWHFGKNLAHHFLCFISGLFLLTFCSFQMISKVAEGNYSKAHIWFAEKAKFCCISMVFVLFQSHQGPGILY